MVSADGKEIPSRIFPTEVAKSRRWKITLGKAGGPYLDQANAIVQSVSYDRKSRKLRAELRSFAGHMVTVKVVSPKPPAQATVDGKTCEFKLAAPAEKGTQGYDVEFQGKTETQILEVLF